MPELLWKSYIDFEVQQGEFQLARQLYERLLERTVHVKVWISYAKFEISAENEEEGLNVPLARRIYERANECLKGLAEKESRVLVLEAWRDFERDHGDEATLKKVLERMPRKVKKRQKIVSESGVEEGWEEVFDFLFPEDEMARPNLKLLAAAKNWKRKQDTDPPVAAPMETNQTEQVEGSEEQQEEQPANDEAPNDDGAEQEPSAEANEAADE